MNPFRQILALLFGVALFVPLTALAHDLKPLWPDPKFTPGATFDVSVQDISTPGYSKAVRNVTAATRRAVFREYGISNPGPDDYEIDRLIPLSLGGSNSLRNLWPESYETVLNAHVKDRLEDRLHALVVRGKVDLRTAQREIAEDWIAAYRKYIGPLARDAPIHPVQAHRANDVWVNSHSGKYFKAGSQWYGKTKSGEYMSESEAISKAYRAARSGRYDASL